MAWYTEKGELQEVVLSTRVRFARNLSEYPFASLLDTQMANEIIEKVSLAFKNYSKISFSLLSQVEAMAYVERHFASLELTDKRIPRALLIGEKEKVQIMLCEEDHIRLQSIVAGFNPELAFEQASEADEILAKTLPLAYSETYGYLTHCPTNLGNAMRVSVMLFLPSLTKTRQIERLSAQLNKLGFTIRGLYGEGSAADGCIYQVSNRSSLGVTESEILKNITDVTKRICESEKALRVELFEREKNATIDRIYRSAAVLKNAFLMTRAEFNERQADIRLGIFYQILSGVDESKLTELMIAVQNATLMLSGQDLNIDVNRDKARASLVKNTLCKLEIVE